MTITYEYGDNLYINVTNQCPNACDFCLRNNSTGSLYADNLWYEGAEPTKEEIEKFADYVESKLAFGSNMRASKEFRSHLCKVLIKRCINEVGGM